LTCGDCRDRREILVDDWLAIYDTRRNIFAVRSTIPVPGGSLEYAVLVALWDLGTATAKEIHARVGAPAGLVYTTVAKVLDRLHAKGLVSRARTGRAFVYRASVERERVERARAHDLIGRFLGPAPQPAMGTLVDAVESLDPELLEELARVIRNRRRSRRGS
jgi:predicted transcriptional regulator